MNTIFVYGDGATRPTTRIDRAWLNPSSGSILWVDLEAPSIPESLLLSDTFGFHPLAVEDAVSARERPKVAPYDGYLFIGLRDVRFFVGSRYLVTVSGGTVPAVEEIRDNVAHDQRLLADGSVSLCHRIVDEIVDRYLPAISTLGGQIDAAVGRLVDRPAPGLFGELFARQADLLEWKHRVAAEEQVVARLARREFIDVSTEMALRFRDVHDHLLGAAEDLSISGDRLAAALAAGPMLAAAARRWF